MTFPPHIGSDDHTCILKKVHMQGNAGTQGLPIVSEKLIYQFLSNLDTLQCILWLPTGNLDSVRLLSR